MKRIRLLIAALGIVSVSLITFAGVVRALPYGLNSWEGYFHHGYEYYGSNVFPTSIPSSVNSANSFISLVLSKLNGSTQERVGASFIIQTMIGSSRSLPPSSSQIADWESRVRYADSHGMVLWGVGYHYTVNSFYQPTLADDAFYSDNSTATSIVFFSSSSRTKVVYAIKYFCANPVGNVSPLPKAPPPPSWKLTGTSSVNAKTAVPGSKVVFTHTVRNLGPDTASFQRLIQYSYPSSNRYGNKTSLVSDSLAKNATRTVGDTVTIPANATPGSVYCERIYFTNASGPNTGAGTSTGACVKVVMPVLSCSMTVSPATLTPASTFKITATIGFQPASDAQIFQSLGYKIYVGVSGPGSFRYGPNALTPNKASGGSLSVTTPTLGPTLSAGTMNVSYGLEGPTGTKFNNCTKSMKVSMPVLSCDMTADPYPLTPESTFTVTATIGFPTSSDAQAFQSAGYKIYVGVSGPGSFRYGPKTFTPTAPKNSSSLTITTPSLGPTNSNGAMNVSYGLEGPTGIQVKSCTKTEYVVSTPYFEVTGGDVSVGAGMDVGGVDCAVSADGKAGVVSWNRGASGNFAGAGTQYAAFALNHLQDFATAQGSSLAPDGLAFANTPDANRVDVPAGLFGGLFGSLACMPDYFANATNVQVGNVTIGGQAIANGTSKTIYVKGNVYITGNVTFSGSYANVGEIPYYRVIVEGNIYIAPGVTQLDGMYVAEPKVSGSGKPSEGIIYTCAPSLFTAQGLNSTLYQDCGGKSLTINGAVTARQLWLLRAIGSLGSKPAETINFTPEVWLATPGTNPGGNPDAYDAITSLPPVL